MHTVNGLLAITIGIFVVAVGAPYLHLGCYYGIYKKRFVHPRMGTWHVGTETLTHGIILTGLMTFVFGVGIMMIWDGISELLTFL